MSLPNRRLATALASLALLAAPASALAQGAGDDQYADPLGNSPQKGSGNSGSSGSSGNSGTSGNSNSQGSSTGNQSTPSSGTQSSGSGQATTSSAPTGSSSQLPRTGLDVGAVAASGALLLASGALLRRRTAGVRG